MSEELKPCPFCGFTFEYADMIDVIYPINRERTLWNVVCVDNAGGCNASSLGGTEREAVDNWNKRVRNE